MVNHNYCMECHEFHDGECKPKSTTYPIHLEHKSNDDLITELLTRTALLEGRLDRMQLYIDRLMGDSDWTPECEAKPQVAEKPGEGHTGLPLEQWTVDKILDAIGSFEINEGDGHHLIDLYGEIKRLVKAKPAPGEVTKHYSFREAAKIIQDGHWIDDTSEAKSAPSESTSEGLWVWPDEETMHINPATPAQIRAAAMQIPDIAVAVRLKQAILGAGIVAAYLTATGNMLRQVAENIPDGSRFYFTSRGILNRLAAVLFDAAREEVK